MREARREDRRERAAERAARGEKGAPIGEPLPPIADEPDRPTAPVQDREMRPGPRLYVGNLSYETTVQMLGELFAAHGEVVDVHIMTDRATGEPRGFGFVTMSRSVQAETIIRATDGAELDGRALRVSIAEERRTGGGPRR